MATLYERLRGGDDIDRLAIQPFLNWFTFIMDETFTLDDYQTWLGDEHRLTDEQIAEFNDWQNQIKANITADLQELWPSIQDPAPYNWSTALVRSIAFVRTWQTLIAIEGGLLTEPQAKAALGIS